MRDLLLGTPNIVLQIVIQSPRGLVIENQTWCQNRYGFEKAVLDKIAPMNDGMAMEMMRKEYWVWGF